MKAFFDTNVLMDVFGKREPFYADSVAAWSLVEDESVEGYVSAVSFANVFYIVRKLVGIKAARTALRIIKDGFSIVSCDTKIVSLAMDSNLRDFEDAIQYYSAREVSADYIVTRNTRDFPDDGKLVIAAPVEFTRVFGADDDATAE